jgi:amino acid adenylation domain-containing protein
VADLKGLSPRQRDLLLRRLAQAQGSSPEAEQRGHIPRQPRAVGENVFPLSFSQQRLWFLDLLEPGSPLYNVTAAFEVTGPLDAVALEAALREVVRRHEALRTTFAESSGGPVQVIHGRGEPAFAVADLRPLPEGERRAEAGRRAHSEARRPFDLTRGPLLRALLLRWDEREHLAVLTVHHIVSDGWSMGVLVREVAALYPAFVAGGASPLPELPLQYADFSVWQREWLAGGALDVQLAFWRERLAGAPAVLELPTDRPRPAVQTTRGGQMPVRLAPPLVAALRETARRQESTLFMVVLAAFELLLQRYADQDDLLVGSPIAGRNRPGIEGLIGFFVNTLVLRGELGGEPSFAELLARVRGTALAAYAHQDLPFERLIEELHPKRDLSRPPVVQVMFTLQRAEAEALELPGLRLVPLDLDSGTAKFELTLHLAEGAESVAGWIEYNADLYDAATAERMAGQLVSLLEGVPEGLGRPAADLPLLPAGQLRELLAAADGGPGEPLEAECLHRLFEIQARRSPDAPAVEAGGERWTYGELDRRANRLAHHLRSLGVGPEVPVALCMAKTPRRLAAVLAILKAGGAYVPLDSAYPAARLAFMLEDSAAPLLLTERELLPSLPAREGVLLLDGDWPGTPGQEAAGPPDRATGGNLAYVIYTSGSTGRPKGVLSSHRGACRLVADAVRRLRLGPGSRIPHNASLSFDVSLFEIFPALAAGAELVFFPSGLMGADLAAELRRHEITSMVFTSPALLETLGREEIPSLRFAGFGGEPCPPEIAARWSSVFELHNCYGPTETTVYSTAARCRPGRRESPPIGRPIAGTRVHVLDRRLRPVPAGVTGEICIGGEGLARGYLGRPDLTAEKFVPDSWSGVPGARFYRTGDLGRWRVNGELEFAGRNDAQVKIRGFRIELGEVEAALHQHPAVERAVATARQDVPGIQRLVVYAVPKPGETPTGAGLRDFLKESLPELMVPSAVVVLASLPLTANDKVDFKALPAPEGTSEAAAGYVVPRNDAERRIAGIWREVLQVERVGADDNFFDLGGHSLLMARAHSRLGEVFPGFELGLVDLFKYPTVGALAARLSSESEEVPAARTGVERALLRRGRAERAGTGVAIVGMACRFPGADSAERFWENLAGGIESITFFTDEQLRAAGVPGSDLANPKYVRARGIVEGAADFDAGFFGYSPREAEVMDPQQRVFLECAWEAFEDAGIDPARFPGDVGVFAGVGMNTYVFNLLPDPEIRDSVGSFQVSIANDKDFLASRVSYKLGLRGPSLSVQTACSTSLVATHLACQSLLSGECDAALAGGVSIRLPQETGHHHHEGAVFSPDGHCRAFDSRAGGFVGGNGAGAVLLKRLEDALRDGDPIRAVIRGSAVNNDGALKVGYTAPGVDGQARVIAQALAVAEVPPETVGYVEAHGTGTDLGDPIEIAALAQAFGPGLPPESCAIGSAKTNIGHLDSAAGVAGLIKAALVLEHGRIPPSLNFDTPNPRLELEKTPFRVNHRLAEWPAGSSPRRAGVSSMGIGGTNAHIVLEEPPARAVSEGGRDWQLLPLSARSEGALAAAVDRLAAHLRRHPEIGLADAAWTLQTGRRRFEQRAFALAADPGQAAAVLESRDPERFLAGMGDARSAAFLFSGQGAQYPGMAAGLYRSEPVFREAVDSTCERLAARLGRDLRALLFPVGGEGEAAAAELARTEITQPALFVIEHALARLWISWGVRPQAMIGHSVGEYVAACLAGVFSLEDALDLVAERGRLMGEMERGAMLAVQLSEAEVAPLLGPGLSLAAVNAPARTVVAGAREAVEALERELETRGVRHRRLRTSHAFHSEMMEPALEPFLQALRRVRLWPPSIPFLSNVTGTWITGQEATDPGYWARHLRGTVRFADGIAELLREPGRALLEVGPGNSLTTLAREMGAPVAIPSLPHAADRRPDAELALTALGRLWLAGIEIDWEAFHAGERRLRVPLPAYAFEHRRYWIEGPGPLGTGAAVRPDLSKRPDPSEWLYAPTWRRALEPARPAGQEGERWLVLDALGIGEGLRREGREVVTVAPGEDLAALVSDLRATGRMPSRIVHLWSLLSDGFESAQDLGFRSLVRLAQALGEGSEAVDLCMVTAGLFEVTGGEELRPERATLLGPARVLPWELPWISCRVVDAEPSADVGRLLREIESVGAPLVALRGRHRWLPEWEPVRLEDGGNLPPRIREDGVYVVTGGLGGVGSELAVALARGRRVRLALLGRTGLPPREEWPARASGDDPVALRIRRVLALEELGAEVLPLAADVTDRGSLRSALEEVRRRFGAIHGAVHAAGAPGGGLIQRKTAEETERGLAARVQGLLLLEELLGNESLDFLVLTSSLGALFGEPGQVDLCAACAFFDARAQARRPGAPVLAIDWDTWREVGMVADVHGLPEELRRAREQALATGIAPEEGRKVFARILERSDLPQVVVSTRDLGMVARHLRDLARGGAAAGSAPVRAAYARPDLRSAYVAPRDETEAAVAAIWQELLGIERVGVHDNFFDLGGHSLLATQVMSRLRETLGANLPLEALFEAPTVGGLAERLAAGRPEATEDGEDLEALLREIESLSADEARALYAEESNERV